MGSSARGEMGGVRWGPLRGVSSSQVKSSQVRWGRWGPRWADLEDFDVGEGATLAEDEGLDDADLPYREGDGMG
jgi:hypothetical protein